MEVEPPPRRLRDILLLPLTCFVVVGALGPLYSDEAFSIGLFFWQLIVGWPIGAVLLIGPAAMLRNAKLPSTVVAGQIAMGVVGVAGVIVVNRDDSSTAGLGFLWVPLVGCAVVGAILGIERLRRTRHAAGV